MSVKQPSIPKFFRCRGKNRTDTDEPSETDAAGDTNLEVRILFSKLLFPKIRVIGAEIQLVDSVQ